MTDTYGSLHFSDIFLACLLLILVHSGAILPFVAQRQVDCIKTSQCQLLFGCTYNSFIILFFMLLEDLSKNYVIVFGRQSTQRMISTKTVNLKAKN